MRQALYLRLKNFHREGLGDARLMVEYFLEKRGTTRTTTSWEAHELTKQNDALCFFFCRTSLLIGIAAIQRKSKISAQQAKLINKKSCRPTAKLGCSLTCRSLRSRSYFPNFDIAGTPVCCNRRWCTAIMDETPWHRDKFRKQFTHPLARACPTSNRLSMLLHKAVVAHRAACDRLTTIIYLQRFTQGLRLLGGPKIIFLLPKLCERATLQSMTRMKWQELSLIFERTEKRTARVERVDRLLGAHLVFRNRSVASAVICRFPIRAVMRAVNRRIEIYTDTPPRENLAILHRDLTRRKIVLRRIRACDKQRQKLMDSCKSWKI